MNHLVKTKVVNIVKASLLIDSFATISKPITEIVHIHCYHGHDLFSKFDFKSGKYDNLTVSDSEKTQSRYYALFNALESKRLSEHELYSIFLKQNKKI
jgi:hypothetical protein